MAKFSKKKEQLTQEPVQKYERSYTLPRKEMMFNNFLGGIMWAIGSVVGLTILFAVIGILTQFVNLIPVIGDFILEILNYINLQNPNT